MKWMISKKSKLENYYTPQEHVYMIVLVQAGERDVAPW